MPFAPRVLLNAATFARARVTHLSLVARLASSTAVPPASSGRDDSEDEATEASFPTSGPYSPRSIEARVSISRRRPAGVSVTRQKPPRSEEDAYCEAGAYSYGEDGGKPPATTQPSPSSSSSSPAPSSSSPSSSSPSSPSSSSPSPSNSFDLFSRDVRTFPVVRVSRGTVSVGNIAAFAKSYQLKAVPAFQSLRGCLSAYLTIEGGPEGIITPDASPAEIMSASFVARGDQGADSPAVTVTSTTIWRDFESLQNVTNGNGSSHDDAASSAYVDAMQALAPYFLSVPEVTLSRQVAATATKETRVDSSDSAGDGVGVGPELGLR